MKCNNKMNFYESTSQIQNENTANKLSNTVYHSYPILCSNMVIAISLNLVPTFFFFLKTFFAMYVDIYPNDIFCLLCLIKSIILHMNVYNLIFLCISKIPLCCCCIPTKHSFSLLYRYHCDNNISYLSILISSNYELSMNLLGILKSGLCFDSLCVFQCFKNDLLTTIPDEISKILFFKDPIILQEVQTGRSLVGYNGIIILPAVP